MRFKEFQDADIMVIQNLLWISAWISMYLGDALQSKGPWQVHDTELADDFKKVDVQHFLHFLNRETLPSVHTEQKHRTLWMDSSASVIKTPWSWTTTEKAIQSVIITAIVLRSVFTTDVAFLSLIRNICINTGNETPSCSQSIYCLRISSSALWFYEHSSSDCFEQIRLENNTHLAKEKGNHQSIIASLWQTTLQLFHRPEVEQKG